MTTKQPPSNVQKIEIVMLDGNKVSFESADGVKLASLRTVASVLKEEIRAITPDKTEKAAA